MFSTISFLKLSICLCNTYCSYYDGELLKLTNILFTCLFYIVFLMLKPPTHSKPNKVYRYTVYIVYKPHHFEGFIKKFWL